ncbi:MAG: hypothetical protein R3B70_20915 [Polyangiaceae bacterium]
MLPLYFGPKERPLFGQFHSAEARPRGPGVLIVNPFGHEELHAHRAERHLAERLAAAGFATLRFDLDATGNSAGDDRDGDRLTAWKASIATAAEELRARTGSGSIVLAGLRAGALLALSVAAEVEAERLVLWMPVQSGRMHARELLRLHRILFPRSKAEGAPPEDEEALGFVLRKDTVAALGKLDLAAITDRPAEGCFVVGGNENPTEEKLLDRLRELGSEVDYVHLPGHPFLVTDPHKSVVPSEMIAAIVDHLSSKYPSPPGTLSRPPRSPRPEIVTGGPGGEEAWSFGSPEPRFGVLSRPAAAPGDKPAIVLMNAGSIHHIGPNRAFVRMARRWADLGYPVLRMDLSGIGESPVHTGCIENVPYPRDAVADAQAAMTALEKHGVARRFILTGLCSGADIAFRAAVIDKRVAAAWMINPQAFHFPSSDSLKEFMRHELEAQYYKAGMFDLDRWKKLVRGEVDLVHLAEVIRGKAVSSVRRRLARVLGPRAPEADDAPEARDVIRDLRAIAERGADTFLLCSEDDPGLVYLLKYFGKGLDDLARVPGFKKEIVKGVDHTFTPVWSQDMLSDMLTDHLTKRHP